MEPAKSQRTAAARIETPPMFCPRLFGPFGAVLLAALAILSLH